MFSQMSVRELRNYCRDHKISGYSAVLKNGGKAALVELLESRQQPEVKPSNTLKPRNNRPRRPRTGERQLQIAVSVVTAIFGALYLAAGVAVDTGTIARTELQPQIEDFVVSQFQATLSPETLECAEKYARYIELQEISDHLDELFELEQLALANYRAAYTIEARDRWLKESHKLSREWQEIYDYSYTVLCH